MARITTQQQVEGSEQRHEESGTVTTAQVSQLFRQFNGELKRMMSAAECLNRRARFVDRQVNESRRAGQLVTPVIKLRSKHIALQPVALPVCEVGILNRQLFERRLFAAHISGIERGHFANQD